MAAEEQYEDVEKAQEDLPNESHLAFLARM
jgi:hypothetical protein